MKARILLVEDEESLRSTLSLNLELEGYEVVSTANGREALQLFKTSKFDLIILDIMLPEINGIDICHEIRKENKKVFILFLSARNLGSERVEGLKAGADDYLSKPFNLEELLLRIEILLKRKKTTLSDPLSQSFTINGCAVNFITYEFTNILGQTDSLSKKEAQVLKLLIERENQVVSRDEILNEVWNYEVFPTGRTIDNFILSFRKNFESDPAHPKCFISIRGVGYKFINHEINNE